MPTTHDLIVIGAEPTGLSIAVEAKRAGLDVLVIGQAETATPMAAVGRYQLTVRFGTPVQSIDVLEDGSVAVTTDQDCVTSRLAVAVTDPGPVIPPIPIDPAVTGRIHTAVPADVSDQDILVVGTGTLAAARAFAAVAADARVVVSFTDKGEGLSSIAREHLVDLEHARRVTVLWHTPVQRIESADGFPMAAWDDRRTPDLVFDHVVFGIAEQAATTDDGGPIIRVNPGAPAADPLGPALAWSTIKATRGDRLPPLLDAPEPVVGDEALQIEELRQRHYNATITRFDHSHEDLWVLRVRPDQGGTAHRAGQYATLGLGYWEPRVDDAVEDLTEKQRNSLIRRSYSISGRMLEDSGYVVESHDEDEIEFYIVHVRPDADKVPALTPRLAGKRPGDRIYLGPKVAGRYTLGPVTDPTDDIVFLATGTGEAPHNAMLTELLRRHHRGRILSVVTVRFLRDLGYEETHRRIEELAPNYTYLPLPTREPGIEKRYIQDLIVSGDLAGMLPHGLDPAHTHVFLCGNPAMIGVPETRGEDETYPEGGVLGLLADRGFTIDRRGVVGNVHFEEYW